MSDPQGLDPKVQKVAQTTRLDTTGDVQRVTTVTYWLGSHGPFYLEYAPGDATSDRIKGDILDQQKKLRDVLMLETERP